MAGPDNREADKSVPDQDIESPDGVRDSPGSDPGLSQDDRLAHFISLLSDDDDVSRWKAAEMLGRLGDPRAVDGLIGALWDGDERVRLKAVWALGRIADPRAYAPLQRLYRMEREGAQEIISEALESIRFRMSGQ